MKVSNWIKELNSKRKEDFMKGLVIYFSHTGENYMENGIRNIDKENTEIVAEEISKLTGADLFKVEPVKEYPYNYQECCDVAKEELENDIRPEVKNHLSSLDNYDTIYIGGPIWWEHYPCPLFTVLEGLDFTGKVVMPFSTHEGSGLGSIMEDVHRFCKNATIKDGLAIRGSSARSSLEKIEKWCNHD